MSNGFPSLRLSSASQSESDSESVSSERDSNRLASLGQVNSTWLRFSLTAKFMSLHMLRKGSREGNFKLPILIASVIPALKQPLRVVSCPSEQLMLL